MSHETRVFAMNGPQSVVEAFYAECTCGWNGPFRASMEQADQDKALHGVPPKAVAKRPRRMGKEAALAAMYGMARRCPAGRASSIDGRTTEARCSLSEGHDGDHSWVTTATTVAPAVTYPKMPEAVMANLRAQSIAADIEARLLAGMLPEEVRTVDFAELERRTLDALRKYNVDAAMLSQGVMAEMSAYAKDNARVSANGVGFSPDMMLVFDSAPTGRLPRTPVMQRDVPRAAPNRIPLATAPGKRLYRLEEQE